MASNETARKEIGVPIFIELSLVLSEQYMNIMREREG